ncbi:hypothetical protein wVul_0930 [Wolbachia endosymbiont of Armadillidium vulgare str. wVulC]|uniref:glycine-rich domain-containing protein n=1 Tax=Wolbachia endosymbiont of Armadillidium vulgare TaxID=77039 RepID=UPI00064A42AD|nr:hypothetical protein [Wolbachia endosymbiont of Armadillidium vulgare]KLT22565.1 hypothetical protein wVul_0930 [Wolbachia endosymbiont of Armadillidium vulgare str. wVulC]OJH31757.1 hypothetical protein Wxf_01160 [Wolbachia endosymbiont of Armadillidium vulgare]OJH32725.1 hypothetical protein Wxf_02177 [Wolbachia endosymbiont of Armadillidium vulgare]OJH33347.1 hypothetical protein Wxf_02831 [Wolbachia endosymbiont of Armadillidium vulgare]
MKNVKFKVKFFFLVLILLGANSGYPAPSCPNLVKTNTHAEEIVNKTGKGLWKIISFDWGNVNYDDHLLKNIKVSPVRNQGVDGYFNPRIRVCDYEGDNCYELYNKQSCQKIYGTQGSGAGVSAAVFIDWQGTKEGDKLENGMNWEWAKDVTEKEREKFANSPKVCACSQKIACADYSTKLFARATSVGKDECDVCYQTKVQCVPVPLAPGPPPFCEQLAMSPPQVRIFPISNQDNDYFHPRVGVIVGELKERRELPFPRVVSSNENIQSAPYSIPDKDTHHHFKTYRKKGRLCTEYYGTEREESERKLQFPARCFPAPPAPELEEVSIPKPDEGKGENTLKVKMKMSENVCTHDARGTHNNGVCTFYVNANSPTYVGHLPLKVVKPVIVAKTTDSSNSKSDIDNIIEGILKNNSQFEVLKKYGYVPNIETECKELQGNKYKLDNSGYPKVEIKYKENSKSKMLCLSGWQPEPEEFALEKESELIPLKSVGASYAKYSTVYSKESNQLYYFPCNETIEVLAKPQNELDEIIFNKKEYIFIPEENKPRDNCMTKEDKEIDTKQNCNKCKIVYELTDGKHEEKNCNQGDDGCLCFDGVCSRSTQYVDKDDKPFYLRVSQDENGVVTKLDNPIKANRTEVFFADKLCRFDLEGLKKKLREIIKKQLESKKQNIEEKNRKLYELGDGYTDNLSVYDYVEIEAWGGGEAGHVIGKAHSTVNKPGRPGDYIKAKLKVNPSYPYIKVKVTEGGGGQEDNESNKDGGPTLIKMCRNSSEVSCKDLITVAGGGTYRTYGGRDYKDTIIHEQNLKLEEEVVKGDELNSRKDNKIAYIRNGEIGYKDVTKCSQSYTNKIYGAGGCINKSTKSYSKGAPGYVKIKPMFDKINKERVKKIDDAIEKMIQNPNDIIAIDDSLINKLDKEIIDTIKEEIKKELLGL